MPKKRHGLWIVSRETRARVFSGAGGDRDGRGAGGRHAAAHAVARGAALRLLCGCPGDDAEDAALHGQGGFQQALVLCRQVPQADDERGWQRG